jgi:hypothetical protein
MEGDPAPSSRGQEGDGGEIPQYTRYLDQDLNPGSLEYGAGV